jgi:hypothetical protein
VEASNKAATPGIGGNYIFAQNSVAQVPMRFQKMFLLTEIPDGSGGIPICGSSIERFDPRSIFNKLPRY